MAGANDTTNCGGDGRKRRATFTEEGLPLAHTIIGAAPPAAVDAHSGPARRITVACLRPDAALVSAAPSVQLLKVPSTVVEKEAGSPLRVGRNDSSLIDEDDDELIYFGANDDRSESPVTTTHEDLSSYHWAVSDDNVPMLTPFYPLEKNAVFVPQTSASVVASRITDALRVRSIAASYDANNAKVDCISSSHVEFRVRLYRGRDEHSRGIIVEVQRRWGFDLGYARDVHAILDASEGKEVKRCEEDTVLPVYHEDAGVTSSSVIGDAGHVAPLRVIEDILCHQDAKDVAMELQELILSSLASLTSQGRMGLAAAQMSSEVLRSEKVSNALFSSVLEPPQGRRFAHRRPMLLSLEILANIAPTTQETSRLTELLQRNDHEALYALVRNVENSHADPQAANLSCVVLGSDVVAHMLPSPLKERLVPALINAVRYGSVHHCGLKGSSRRCLELVL